MPRILCIVTKFDSATGEALSTSSNCKAYTQGASTDQEVATEMKRAKLGLRNKYPQAEWHFEYILFGKESIICI